MLRASPPLRSDRALKRRAGAASLIIVALLLSGCGAEAASTPRSPERRQGAKPAESNPRERFAELQRSVRDFESKAPDARIVAQALKALADTLQIAGESQASKLDNVRVLARNLGGSSDAERQSALFKDALSDALEVLLKQEPPGAQREEYEAAVAALGRTLEAVRRERPLLEQRERVREALRAAANASFLRRGLAAPFDASELTDVVNVQSVRVELDDARAEVLELGQLSWDRATAAAGRALSSLADALTAADCERRLRGTIGGVRFEAARLSDSGGVGLQQAAWIKTGLSNALDALDRLAPAQEGGYQASSVTADARKSVAAISEQQSFVFQRAGIQDAYRATLNALLLRLRLDACSQREMTQRAPLRESDGPDRE